MDTTQLDNIHRVIIDSVEYIKRTDTLEFYSDIANKQATQFTILISVLCGITVLLLAASWWWNMQGAKNQIRSEVESAKQQLKGEFETDKTTLGRLLTIHKRKVTSDLSTYKEDFNGFKGSLQKSVNNQIDEKIDNKLGEHIEQNDKDIKELKESLEQRLLLSEAENARIFAAHNESNGSSFSALSWWFIALEKYSLSDHNIGIGISVNTIDVLCKKISTKLPDNIKFDTEKNIDIANKYIPDIMIDKREDIIKKLNLLN